MRNFLKQYAFPVFAAGALVLALIVSGSISLSQTTVLTEQAEEISALESKLTMTQGTVREAEVGASLLNSGADPLRLKADREPIARLVDLALTWSDDKSYNVARAEVMSRYGLDESSAFMTSFLPEAPFSTDSQGNRYPYIDAAGLNSRVGSMTVDLLGVRPGSAPTSGNGPATTQYDYLVSVVVQGKSSDGGGTAMNLATILVTVDGDQNLSDVRGYPSTKSPRASK